MIFNRAPLPNPPPLERKLLRNFDDLLLRYLNEQEQNLDNVLSNGLRFEDNADASLVSVASHATPGTEFSVAHELGKAPVGYIVYGQTAAGSIYDGVTTNTETTLYFKSDVSAVTFRLIVF